MSDTEPELSLSLPNRRLSIRNSRIVAPPISFSGSPYTHSLRRRRSSSSSGISGLSPQRKKIESLDGDDHEWESDSESPNAGEGGRGAGGGRRRGGGGGGGRSEASYLYAPTTHHRRGRSTDGSAKYIDYLERQVSDLTSQLQGYTTATSSTSHAAKMRLMQAENRTLRHEISEWENNFDFRVNQEADNRQAVDESLRTTIDALESQLEDCEHQLRMAIMEAKNMRRRCEMLKGIEEENRNLEVKIEALTELLADSRNMQRSASASSEEDQGRETPFPQRLGNVVGSPPPPIPTAESEVSLGRASNDRSLLGMEDYGITDPIDMIYAMGQQFDAPVSRASSRASSAYSPVSFAGPPPMSPVSFTGRPPMSPIPLAGGPPRSPMPLLASPILLAGGPPQSPMRLLASPNIRSRRLRRSPSGSPTPKTKIIPSTAVVTQNISRSLFTSPTRPMSASSDVGMRIPQQRPDPDTMRSKSFPNPHRNSLFAELARAESDSDDSGGEEAHSEKEGHQNHSSEPSSPEQPHNADKVHDNEPEEGEQQQQEEEEEEEAVDPSQEPFFQPDSESEHEPEGPEYDTFDMVADAISNPKPLVVKVLGAVANPRRTITTARQKTMSMVGGAVNRGVDRVVDRVVSSSSNNTTAARRPPLTTSKRTPRPPPPPPPSSLRPPRKSRVSQPLPPSSSGSICKECGQRKGSFKKSSSAAGGSVGGLRKRSGSVVQPVAAGEDGMDVIWLWVRFIIAVVVALGVAVKDGPPQAVLMLDDGEGIDHVTDGERERALKRLEGKR